jgi:hypothetical protein
MGGFKIGGMHLPVMKLDIIPPLVVYAKPVYPSGINGIIIGQAFRIVPVPGIFIIFDELLYGPVFFCGIYLLTIGLIAKQPAQAKQYEFVTIDFHNKILKKA